MNTKNNKRLFNTARANNLESNTIDLASQSIPLKKRKINNIKVDEIRSLENKTQKFYPEILNLNLKKTELSANLSNSFLNSSNQFSSSISSITNELNKINFKKENLKTSQLKKNSGKSDFILQNPERKKNKTLNRNFSLSELNTQNRTNFKNTFEEIVKNYQNSLNRNSLSSSHSNIFKNSNSNNLLNKKPDLKFYEYKRILPVVGKNFPVIVEKSPSNANEKSKEFQTPKFQELQEETPNFKQIEVKEVNNRFEVKKENVEDNPKYSEYLIPNKKIQCNYDKAHCVFA